MWINKKHIDVIMKRVFDLEVEVRKLALYLGEKEEKSAHSVCPVCGEVGHIKDMVFNKSRLNLYIQEPYYHKKCYQEKSGLKPCSCGKGWVGKEKRR